MPQLDLVAGNLGFCEGPIWCAEGGVTFTSTSLGHVYGLEDGQLTLRATPGGIPNGAAEGADGTIFLAMAGGRLPGRPPTGMPSGIAALRPFGRFEWLTTDPIAPNDLCFGPDGHIYLSDPTRNGRRDDGRIWRVDPVTGDADLLVSVHWFPNGIGFGPEDDALYVSDTGNRRIMRFPLRSDGLGLPEVAVQLQDGMPDGFAFDTDGNLLVAAFNHSGRASLQTWTRDGTRLDVHIGPPNSHFSNVALDPAGRLLVTEGVDLVNPGAGSPSGGGIYRCGGWPTAGIPLHPFRNAA